MKFYLPLFFIVLGTWWCSSCSVDRFLPEEGSLLASVRLKSTDVHVRAADYRLHIRQEANSRWLSAVKMPMRIYCLSGTNERLLFNRIMHRVGEAPVVFNDTLMRRSQASLAEALRSKGYLDARVDTTVRRKGRRVHLTYTLRPGARSYVQEIRHVFDNDTIARLLGADSLHSRLYRGMPLDVALLNEERARLVNLLKNRGYLNLNNDFIGYTADTLAHSQAVVLTQHFRRPSALDATAAYRTYRVRRVNVYESAATHEHAPTAAPADSSFYRGLFFFNHGTQKIHRRIYFRNIFVQADSLYNERATQYTYQNLNALPAVNYSSIHYAPPQPGDSTLDANIFVRLTPPHSISFDLEGTNTAGDLGGAGTLSYTHRNLLHGAESFSLKLRGAYESIRRLEGYANQDYFEYGAEATLRFPGLLLPVGPETLRRYKGSTDFSALYNSQNRPEFHRRLLTATWTLNWSGHGSPNWRNRFDVVSLNYVFMPWISDTFREEYLEGSDPRYAVLRYSYENLFIMRSAYGFTYTSLKNGNLYQSNGYQVRFNLESAGNLLYAFSKLTGLRRNTDGEYALLNIPYSQYLKLDLDYSQSLRLGETRSLAFHVAFGIALPYGNSKIIPYEKRYFAGGANSVRGWSVRTLGPGAYVGKDGNIDFINQTGNLRFNASIEYRAPLFWKFEGAAFIDAGNVWNTRRYTAQPDGQFQFDTFYKQIAMAYGFGLRLNLNYFILRFDGGFKAIDPAYPAGRKHYPILSPNLGRNFALHFAVGLPF